MLKRTHFISIFSGETILIAFVILVLLGLISIIASFFVSDYEKKILIEIGITYLAFSVYLFIITRRKR